jgi:hypothetical protein
VSSNIKKYTFINTIKSRNPLARELSDLRYRKRIVRDRTQYTRKCRNQEKGYSYG